MDGVSERGGHPVIRKVISFSRSGNIITMALFLFLCFETSHGFYSDIVYYQAAHEAMDAEDHCLR